MRSVVPCCEVIPRSCRLNLTYMQPTAKKLWFHFFRLRCPQLCIPITSFLPAFAYILAETDHRTDLAENHAVVGLIFSSFPSSILAEGR